MGRTVPDRGRRHHNYQRALRETDPLARDKALALAEAALIGTLTSDINNQYGDSLQDPTDAHLVSSQMDSPTVDPTSEAYWTQGGLTLSRSYDMDHGWSVTPTNPTTGV